MIPESKYPEIVRGLLEKTLQQKAQWVDAGRNISGNNMYFLSLPHSRISVSLVSPQTEPDYLELEIFNGENARVGRWAVSDGEPNWNLLNDLYQQIIMKITRWDKVLEEI